MIPSDVVERTRGVSVCDLFGIPFVLEVLAELAAIWGVRVQGSGFSWHKAVRKMTFHAAADKPKHKMTQNARCAQGTRASEAYVKTVLLLLRTELKCTMHGKETPPSLELLTFGLRFRS